MDNDALEEPAVVKKEKKPRVDLDTDWCELLRDYIAKPRKYWKKVREPQIEKLEREIEAARIGLNVKSAEATVETAIELAEARAGDRPLTVFLINSGGAGSHWLEKVMYTGLGLLECREVYIPVDIMKIIRWMPIERRSCFLDALHILHSQHYAENLKQARFVNSAHLSGWKMSTHIEAPKANILLTRDPVETVLSRTFRKPLFLKDYEQGFTSSSPLAHNIDHVRKFYDLALEKGHDCHVRYEDMREDLGGVVRRIGETLDIPVSDAKVDEAVEKFGYVPLDQRDETVRTNAYKGPKVEIPDEIRAHVKAELEGVAETFGY